MRVISETISAALLDFNELTPSEAELLREARLARLRAQAPYSGYLVGAAVRSASTGRIYIGCNVERATYTQTTHAEQTAIDSMIAAEGPTKIAALATVGGALGDTFNFSTRPPHTPEMVNISQVCPSCGHCLQIIWENCFGDPNVALLTVTPWGEIAKTTIGNALPMRFGPDDLGIDYGKF